MEPLNYCRQMTKQFSEAMVNKSLPEAFKERMAQCITMSSLSEKFILPEGGNFIDDIELRALDESGRLHLPFKAVALEYQCPPSEEGYETSTKRIIFAVEVENGIIFRCVAWIDSAKTFRPYALFKFEHGNYLRRDQIIDGAPSLAVRDVTTDLEKSAVPDEHRQIEREDSLYEARVLLGFINALTCSNVSFERREQNKSGKKIKAALPFDTYHVLTVDIGNRGESIPGAGGGTHRSPREHLRRGHIRRLADSRRIWVNAAVVGAKKGAGVVTKDYRISNENH